MSPTCPSFSICLPHWSTVAVSEDVNAGMVRVVTSTCSLELGQKCGISLVPCGSVICGSSAASLADAPFTFGSKPISEIDLGHRHLGRRRTPRYRATVSLYCVLLRLLHLTRLFNRCISPSIPACHLQNPCYSERCDSFSSSDFESDFDLCINF